MGGKEMVTRTAVLLCDGSGAARALASDLASAGVDVLAVVDDCRKLVQTVVRCAPEVVVVDVSTPQPLLWDTTKALSLAMPTPVLLFAQDADVHLIDGALASGVHAYVVQGYAPARLLPLLHLAQARFAQEQALQKRLQEVTDRLEERKVVERAKGILMRARDVSDDDAFQILRTASMHTNQRLGQVSQQIIHSAQHAEAVNRAGQLRMLSQRLVTLYLLRGAGVQVVQQQSRLEDALLRVDDNLAWLGKGPSAVGSADRVRVLLATWAPLKTALQGATHAERVPLVVDGAERLLTDAEQLTTQLQHAGAVATLQVLNVAGRQRMLSQRYARLVVTDLLGLAPDPVATRADMAATSLAFEQALAYLNGLPLSTPSIRGALENAALDWRQVLSAGQHGGTLSVRERQRRLETVAQASEALLACFEGLSADYAHSMHMLMG